jgi:hypothetical protein
VLNRRQILFQYFGVDDFIQLLSEETDRFTEKYNSRHMGTRDKSKSNAQGLHRSMCLPRIFLDHNCDMLGHKEMSDYVKERNGSQESMIPERTTRPQREMFESIS